MDGKKTWTERIDRGGGRYMRWDGNNQTRMGTGIRRKEEERSRLYSPVCGMWYVVCGVDVERI
jgi:hypothetical protein